MKQLKFFLSCLSMLALAVSFTACDSSDDPEDVVEVPAPEVTLTPGVVAETTLAFTLETKNAKEAAWICVEKGTAAPTADKVLADGETVEANKKLSLVAENLTADTDYEIYAAAKNGTKLTLSNPLAMKTIKAGEPVPAPAVTLKAGEITDNSVAFTVTSENAEEVKWQIVAKGTALKAEDVLANGEAVEANTVAECVAEELTAETEYDIYAAAKAGDEMVLSQVLSVKTLKSGDEPVTPPSVSVAAVNEKTTTSTVTFTITSENAEEVKYAVLPEMALAAFGEITAEKIYNQSLGEVEPNTTVEVTAEVYMENTLFLVYAVAKSGEQLVLSEKVEITTLSTGGDDEESLELPIPSFASFTLDAGQTADKYTFALSYDPPFDDPTADNRSLYLMFDLYTEAGLNGAIPTDEYPIAGAEAGMVDLSTLNLVLSDTPLVVEEGMITVELYEDAQSASGWNALIEGELFVEGEEAPYALLYDGPIDRYGIKQGGDGSETTVTIQNAWHSRPTKDDGVTPLAGQFNVFFSYTDDNSQPVLVTLCFNGPDLAYLATGHYPVTNTAMPTGWVNADLSSVEAGIPPIPESLEEGDAFNVRVETMLDLEPTNPQFADYYSIEFYIKTKGLYSPSKIIKATYQGPLGFSLPGQEGKEYFDLYYNYVTAQQGANNTLDLSFTSSASAGSFMNLNVNGTELPKVESSEWTWMDINSGMVNDPYNGQGNLTENTGKLGVKYRGAVLDSYEGVMHPEYEFITEGIEFTMAGMTYTSRNTWIAGDYSVVVEAPKGDEIDLVFTTGKAVTSADGTETVVDMSDDAGNAAHLVFRLASMYAGAFKYLYGSGMSYMLGSANNGSEMWAEAAQSTITYNGKTYTLPEADMENELYYGFNVTCGMPYADENAISLISPIELDGGVTLNSLTFGGSLYAEEETVTKPYQDWSKVQSGFKNMYVESNGTSHKVTLNSFSNGDMVFFIEGVESIYDKQLNVGKEITRESYLMRPGVEDESGSKEKIYGNGYVIFYSPTADNKVQVYTGYKDDPAGDTRLMFETSTNIIWFDSGDKGWTATLK